MSKNKQNVNQEALEQLKGFPEDKPVFMLNYLNYKDVVFEHIDAEIIFKGKPVGIILGPPEESIWDEVLIVKYATKYEFFKLSQDKEYPMELRAAALSDSRLIFCE